MMRAVSTFGLHSTAITAADATPGSWLLALHGIYGSGGNWRTFARKLVETRRDWGVELVDLRMHGRSQGAPPPHTIDAAAADIARLSERMAGEGRTVRAVSGHSFGGKVALRHRGSLPENLLQTWMLDASPSARQDAFTDPNNTVVDVLDMLDALPTSFDDRDQFIDEVTARGKAKPLAQWLAMNLDREGDAYRFRLDLDAMRALLASYYDADLWSMVGGDQDGELRVVAAGKSSALSEQDKNQLRAASVELAQVHIHELPESGHWVHIEALSDLLELFETALPYV